MPSDLVRDALALAGACLVGAGLWWIHPAAALVAGGAALLGVAWLMRRRV